MAGLRTARNLLPYLTLATCGLLLVFVCVFHDNRRPGWMAPSDVVQSSTSLQYDGPEKDYSDSKINSQNPVLQSKFVSDNTSLNVKPDGNKTLLSNGNLSFSDESGLRSSSRSDGRDHVVGSVYRDKSHVMIDTTKSESEINQNLKNRTNVHGTLNIHEDSIHDNSHFDSSADVYLLGDILVEKISASNVKKKLFKPTCETDFKLANSCNNNKCLQTELPDNVTARVEQLVVPRTLQMSQQEHEILREMAGKVAVKYDVVFLTAASSNHFMESQALLKNLHENVYPHMKNFTLVFYNLGLTEKERILMVKYCKCQVIDFPFHKFPPFMKSLKCYAWKPVLIKAHLQNANVVFWMDASIRFYNAPNNLHAFIDATRRRGLQIGGSSSDSAFRTYRSMYHFFGDEPCAYLPLGQAKATLGVYNREYFVDRVILEPWVACALNEDCMCPRNRSRLGCRDSKIVVDKYYQGTGSIVYGMCHRYDQSAISIIIHKLYQGLYRWIMVRVDSVLGIQRKHTFSYFPLE